MGWGSAFTRLDLQKLLLFIMLFEMLHWFIMGAVTMMVFYFKDKNNREVLNEIKADFGSSKLNAAAEAKYRALILEWEYSISWLTVISAVFFLVQFFLYFGLIRKNRCLIFCWILFTVILGIARTVMISTMNFSSAHNYLKYSTPTMIVRILYIYLAAKYMLQLTNENLGAEEVEPPSFRPQTEDPREFREGLNYPTYPRTLQFQGRIAAVNKEEHPHPKRWVPYYDAWDADGRMVVVVDDPVYEAL